MSAAALPAAATRPGRVGSVFRLHFVNPTQLVSRVKEHPQHA